MNHTTNYQLNQWAKSDRLMMDDFNADNTKIDAALGALQIVTGIYTGSGNGAFFALAVDTEDAADNGYLALTDTGFAAKSTLATGDGDTYYSRNPFRYIAWR